MGIFSRKKSSTRVTRRVYGNLGYNEQQRGLPDLEFMTELSPPEGLEKYRKMERNDPIVGGLLLRIRNILRRIKVTIYGPHASFVEDQLLNLPRGIDGLCMEMSSALTFGFYIGEMIWAVDNGKVILTDVEPRYQPSINRINDENGEVVQFTMQGIKKIPYTKCLHHVFIEENRSPYGVSLLRHLYKPYYYKVSCEASEAVGIDRDLSGLPVLKAPEGFDFSRADSSSPDYDEAIAETLNWAIDLVSNIRKDSQQGVVLPSGWELELIRGTGNSTLDVTTTIQRYNTEMAAGLLEMFMAIGQGSSASKGNVEAHLRDFLLSCDSYAQAMADTINNQLIPKICQYNGFKSKPTIEFSTTNVSDLAALASFVARLVKSGVITPTIPIEKALLAIADLPYSDDPDLQKEVLQ